MQDENQLLEYLPKKLRADVAISVHFQTLSKVQLFQVRIFIKVYIYNHEPFIIGLYICNNIATLSV